MLNGQTIKIMQKKCQICDHKEIANPEILLQRL